MNTMLQQQAAPIIDHILRVEGPQYTNHPSDAGGPTKYGITQATLSRFLGRPASIQDVQGITEGLARTIYFKLYVDDPDFDLIPTAKLALELIDSGVNVGTGRASTWLQRALNMLNNRGRDYADLVVDGDIGPRTIQALDAFVRKRGAVNAEKVLLRMVDSMQGAHYIALAEARQTQEDFIYGWFLNRVGTGT